MSIWRILPALACTVLLAACTTTSPPTANPTVASKLPTTAAQPTEPPDPEAPSVGEPPTLESLVASAQNLMTGGDIAGAKERWDRVLALNPDDELALTSRGRCLNLLRQYEAAIRDLSRAAELHLSWELPFRYRADSFAALGRHEEAIDDLYRALSISPVDAAIYTQRATVWRTLKKFSEAKTDLDRAIDLAPTSQRYRMRGVLKSESGDIVGAVRDLELAIELAPNPPASLWGQLGDNRAARGDLEGSLEAFNRGIELEPSPALLGPRALVHQRRNDLQSALRDLNRAIELDPSIAIAWNNRAEIRSRLGDKAGAMADLDRGIELGLENYASFRQRAIWREEAGDLTGALDDYERAQAVQPDSIENLSARSRLRFLAGNLDGARADYQRLLELPMTRSTDYRRRGTAAASFGHWDQALKDFEQGLAMNPLPTSALPIYRYLAARRLKVDDATARLREALPRMSGDWVVTISRFLVGDLTEAEFLAAAARGNPQTVREQSCDAYYYSGVLRLLANDTAAAREHFEDCLATKVSYFVEYQLAKSELERMTAAQR